MRTPSFRPCASLTPRRQQRGVAIVEFALVTLFIFFPLLLGIMEFGRWMFTLNAAAEATRLGARLAVVCSNSSTDVVKIKDRMRFFVGGLTNDQIVIAYAPPACDTAACTVTVSLVNTTFTPLIPYFGVPVPIPPFTTTLPREYMKSAGNPVCP